MELLSHKKLTSLYKIHNLLLARSFRLVLEGNHRREDVAAVGNSDFKAYFVWMVLRFIILLVVLDLLKLLRL